MLPAFVRAGGGNRPVVQLDHMSHGSGLQRVANADPPRLPGLRPAADKDVAAGIDGVVSRSRRIEDPGCLLDRPALDDARWIEAAIGTVAADVEMAKAFEVQLLAEGHDPTQLQAALGDRQLSAPKAAHLAVG